MNPQHPTRNRQSTIDRLRTANQIIDAYRTVALIT
jgi:hypothetical protein